VAFAVEGDGIGFATESYASSALYTTLASLSDTIWRIRRARQVTATIQSSHFVDLSMICPPYAAQVRIAGEGESSSDNGECRPGTFSARDPLFTNIRRRPPNASNCLRRRGIRFCRIICFCTDTCFRCGSSATRSCVAIYGRRHPTSWRSSRYWWSVASRNRCWIGQGRVRRCVDANSSRCAVPYGC
jgi:hypothetical protein